jgi:hypothetical protein
MRLPVVFTSAALLVLAGAVNASAYGTEHLFQITFSENCVNPTLCVAGPNNPFGIGGIWGWVEPDLGGSADAQVTFQGHRNADPMLNGTVHLPSDWRWEIITLTPPPPPFISPPDPNNHYFHFTIPAAPFPFEFLTPATPGKYSENLGPGINANITVTQMH